jgi:hypothetical protein
MDALVSQGEEPRPVALGSLARHPADTGGRRMRRGALGRIPGAAAQLGAGGSQEEGWEINLDSIWNLPLSNLLISSSKSEDLL